MASPALSVSSPLAPVRLPRVTVTRHPSHGFGRRYTLGAAPLRWPRVPSAPRPVRQSLQAPLHTPHGGVRNSKGVQRAAHRRNYTPKFQPAQRCRPAALPLQADLFHPGPFSVPRGPWWVELQKSKKPRYLKSFAVK